MSFDIVLIPAYYRPEYLSLCLEYLERATGSRDDKEYWVCQDFRPDDNHRFVMQEAWTKEVIEKSPLPVRFIRREAHNFSGNSCNTLEAYKEAYATDARYIYLVEEDVLVTPDFFLWHEAIQKAEESVMCSIAYRCSRNTEARKDVTAPEAYFTSARDYASIGVCWRRERLRSVIEHARSEYYGDQTGYILRTFPGNRFSGDFCEQDGLIMRVMWERRGFTAWPYVPRCYHFGWFGYHRPNGQRPDGQLQNKIHAIRDCLGSAERIRAVAPDFGDIEPYNEELNKSFTNLERLERFV